MNPFINKALGSVISVVLTGAVTWLIAKGYLTADAGAQLIAILTSLGLIAAQRVWKKFGDQKVLLTAVATTAPTTLAVIEAKVADGQSPSVNTPADVVPVLSSVP